MKIIRPLMMVILLLLAIFFIGGMFLPKSHRISKSIEINAADSTVYDFVMDFHNFNSWSPWYKMEPTAQTSMMGEMGKSGYTYAWNGEKVGKGKLEVLSTMPNQNIMEELTFYMPDPSVHQANFYFESTEPGKTKITWTMEGDNKPIFERWLYSLFVNRMVGKDYEEGLKTLKTILEKKG